MSALYQKRLADLKKELSKEKEKRKKTKKKFTQNQQIMIDFINSVTKNATFHINGVKITLKKGWGDGKGIEGAGFQHILEKQREDEKRLLSVKIRKYEQELLEQEK